MASTVTIRLLIASAVLVLLGGCGAGLSAFGGKQPRAVVGWYCVDNAETGIKDCEKRLLRKGVPVNDEVYERLGATARPTGDETRHSSPGDASPLTAINPLGDGGGLQVENRGPPPRAVRSYVDRSGEKVESADSGEL